MFKQLGVIGCGLIGGSFALGLRRAGIVRKVVGYSKSPSTTERARRLGVIDVAAESALLAVSGSDIVIVAVPVAATESTFKAIRHLVDPEMLVMDVGSTKRDVVDAARRVLRERLPSFVPAHPIAGKEAAGIDHADAALFSGRSVILTPLRQTRADHVQRASDAWQALGATVLTMSPEDHDAAFAAVSHLPHLLAFAYFSAVMKHPAGQDYMALAGPGFRDFTRIAASDPAIWRDILIANREEVLKQSSRFRHTLDALELVMQSGNAAALEDLIRGASAARSSWQMGQPGQPARTDRAGRAGQGNPPAASAATATPARAPAAAATGDTPARRGRRT